MRSWVDAPNLALGGIPRGLLTQVTGIQVRTAYAIGTVPELLAPGWTGYVRRVYEQPVAYTIDSYVGYVSTRDRLRRLAGERTDELLERLLARLQEEVPSGAFVERNLAYVVSARRA